MRRESRQDSVLDDLSIGRVAKEQPKSDKRRHDPLTPREIATALFAGSVVAQGLELFVGFNRGDLP